MKNQILLLFIFFTSITFSQKITGKILDSETKEPIERAHVFFNLKKEKSISFSVSHIKYETQNINFTLNKTPLVIYLHEKQETLEGIKISTNKKTS